MWVSVINGWYSLTESEVSAPLQTGWDLSPQISVFTGIWRASGWNLWHANTMREKKIEICHRSSEFSVRQSLQVPELVVKRRRGETWTDWLSYFTLHSGVDLLFLTLKLNLWCWNKGCAACKSCRVIDPSVNQSGVFMQTDFYSGLNMIFLFTWRLIVVDIYPLQLQLTVTLVAASGIDAMLITDHLPELRWGKKRTLQRLIL